MEIFWIVLVGFIVGYLIGSFPTGYILAKTKGIEIKKVGSGSIGGTNVARVLGWKYGLLVIIIDILKCFGLVAISYWVIRLDWLTVAIILAVMLGHIFPCYIRFKGGKGIAVLGGGLIPLLSWTWGPLIGIWAVIFFLARKMSLANLLAVLLVPLALWFSQHSLAYLILGILVVMMIYFAHRENIVRLWQGKEPKTTLRF